MTKWLITRSSKHGAQWQLIDFCGPAGAESRGVVDLIAIRKDHRLLRTGNRGDFLEIVLVQVKGGASPMPTAADVDRLRAVKKFHRASEVVLSEWKRGRALAFRRLAGHSWKPVAAQAVFGKVPRPDSALMASAPRRSRDG